MNKKKFTQVARNVIDLEIKALKKLRDLNFHLLLKIYHLS